MESFVSCDDKCRNSRFKLIPNVSTVGLARRKHNNYYLLLLSQGPLDCAEFSWTETSHSWRRITGNFYTNNVLKFSKLINLSLG